MVGAPAGDRGRHHRLLAVHQLHVAPARHLPVRPVRRPAHHHQLRPRPTVHARPAPALLTRAGRPPEHLPSAGTCPPCSCSRSAERCAGPRCAPPRASTRGRTRADFTRACLPEPSATIARSLRVWSSPRGSVLLSASERLAWQVLHFHLFHLRGAVLGAFVALSLALLYFAFAELGNTVRDAASPVASCLPRTGLEHAMDGPGSASSVWQAGGDFSLLVDELEKAPPEGIVYADGETSGLGLAERDFAYEAGWPSQYQRLAEGGSYHRAELSKPMWPEVHTAMLCDAMPCSAMRRTASHRCSHAPTPGCRHTSLLAVAGRCLPRDVAAHRRGPRRERHRLRLVAAQPAGAGAGAPGDPLALVGGRRRRPAAADHVRRDLAAGGHAHAVRAGGGAARAADVGAGDSLASSYAGFPRRGMASS